jgi:hypothetical protein
MTRATSHNSDQPRFSGLPILAILVGASTFVGIRNCGREPIPRVPWSLAEDHAARRFFNEASRGPVVSSLCTESGGVQVGLETDWTGRDPAKRFEGIARFENAAWIAKDRTSGSESIHVSFGVTRAPGVISVYVCTWPTK